MKRQAEYLIVGASAAGMAAAEELRQRDANAGIAVLSDEKEPGYSRILLTKYLEGGIEKQKLFLRDKKWFDEQKIIFVTESRAELLDAEKKIVTTESGDEIEYGKLLIASGVRPRLLSARENGADIFYLWNLEDAEKILQAFREIKPRRAAVVGGGFIGQAFLKICRARGLETHLYMRGEYYWSKILGKVAGELINKKFIEQGIILHKSFEAAGEEIKGDIVFAGVGMKPNIEWLAGSGVETDDGVRVNERMETSARDVYAAGDVVKFFDAAAEEYRRQGNWANAARQGRIAGANMAGANEEFCEVTVNALDIFGLPVVFLGDTRREAADEVVEKMSGADAVKEIFVKDGKIRGAALAGDASERGLLEAAIKDKMGISKIYGN
ncbi:MAG: FAD-dependent oxidoreductase [Patescibacteria group bacterium]|nr:FAD-dependent oxidoreductase [Patescibacteria group bacterium]